MLQAVSAPLSCYCYDRSAQYDYVRLLLCGSLEAKDLLLNGPEPDAPHSWSAASPAGLQAINPPYGFSNLYIPGKNIRSSQLEELLASFLNHKKLNFLVYTYVVVVTIAELLCDNKL